MNIDLLISNRKCLLSSKQNKTPSFRSGFPRLDAIMKKLIRSARLTLESFHSAFAHISSQIVAKIEHVLDVYIL